MRALFVCTAMAIMGSAACAEPEDGRIKKYFQGYDYTVTWGTAPTYDRDAELEIGDGSGHGGTLGWMRFRPGQGGVDVLSIQLDEGREPYESTWPPDRAPVAIRRARMEPDAYAALLRDLAVVAAAKLEPIKRNSSFWSLSNFWVYARLTSNKQTLLDLDWAGYWGSREEVNYAKPKAAVALAREAVKGLDFKEHTLTEGERGWAGVKFARDWKKLEDLHHWWVRERYIIMIGVVGDATALPTLRDVIGSDPGRRDARDRLLPRVHEDRCVYYAINAITRLAKTDVRDKPVEEMDLEKTRSRVLDLLKRGE